MDLKGKTAIVTGGSGGIGRAIAVKLGSMGVNVVVNYHGNQQSAQAVVDELVSIGVKAVSVKANISDSEEVRKMFETVHEMFGSIDILVNNSGITRDGLLIRMPDADFDDVVDTNLKGTFYCIRAAAKYMIKQRYGKIVNIASVVGVTGNAGQANYAASKAGIIGLTKSAAKELSGRNINVNAVAPGFITTSMTDALPDKIKNDYLDKIPLKRLGSPDDVAGAVVFLCCDMANYITGQVINIDGGMVM
jgi:3-oxoacyl-(acyl-carrier-protein) reductase